MDNVRNIISNLYIYKFQNNDNLNMNIFGMKSSLEDSPSKQEITEKSYHEVNNSKITNNKNIYQNININNNNNSNIKQKAQRLDNYNQKYISIKNNNFLKNEINYVLKNKELLREQEMQMKELKIKKENDALNLLLSNKARNNNSVRSKLYDYELKQKQNKKKLQKNNNSKLRNLSSQKPRRYYISKINNNDYDLEQIQEYKNKLKSQFTKSVKLPTIQVKPSSSPMLEGVPILHKDFGKMPEYLEKRKKEIKEQKELEIKEQKEKKLPMGYKILSEEERKERLKNLNDEKRNLEEGLYKLPVARLSEKQKKAKSEIEKQLYEIDEKIYKLIGYKEVIVKEDK